MPSTSTSRHPSGLIITFDEATHSYTDNLGRPYASVTSIVKRLFRPFDAAAISARVAARDGRTPEEVRAEWKAKGDAACRMGTRVHANIEARLLGRELPFPEPETDREREAQEAGWQAAGDVLAGGAVSLHPEMVLASPEAAVAGTMDLLAVFAAPEPSRIIDWKTNGEIAWESRYGDRALAPYQHLHDCEAVRYALQLGIYRWIILHDGYAPPATAIDRWLCHLAPGCTTPAWFQALDLTAEVDAIMADRVLRTAEARTAAAAIIAQDRNDAMADAVLGPTPGAAPASALDGEKRAAEIAAEHVAGDGDDEPEKEAGAAP